MWYFHILSLKALFFGRRYKKNHRNNMIALQDTWKHQTRLFETEARLHRSEFTMANQLWDT